MYKKIMVAIGDDEISRNALKEALHLASAYGARICLVHAVAEPGDDEDEYSGPGEQAGLELLEQAKSTVAEAVAVETRLLEADKQYGLSGVSDAISNAVTEWGADLLVVGTKGRRGLERLVIGSVAGKLVNIVDISILLVRLP
jgi:nucleotide-binding universal stress UspA family protein